MVEKEKIECLIKHFLLKEYSAVSISMLKTWFAEFHLDPSSSSDADIIERSRMSYRPIGD